MEVKARVMAYRVSRCGYYNGPRRRSRLFGDLPQVLADLNLWVNGDEPLTVSQTQTFTQEQDSRQLPVFCYSIHINDGGDSLLVTWNETETANGFFAAVHGDEQVGNPGIDTTEVAEGTIPGFPTYFWIMPDQSLVITIVFAGQSNGHQGMDRYMAGFLEKHAHWVRYASDDESIVGYFQDGEDAPVEDAHPSFVSRLIVNRGHIDFIRDNRSKIRRMIRRETFDPGSEVLVPAWRRVFGWFVGEDPDEMQTLLPQCKEKMQFSMDHTPSEDELDRIIAHWSEAACAEHLRGWDDVGFEFSEIQGTHWLGKARAKDELVLDLEWKQNANEIVYNEERLLTQLQPFRQRLIDLANRSQGT